MHERVSKVMELRQMGRSYQDIALELGVAPSTACEYTQAGIRAATEDQN